MTVQVHAAETMEQGIQNLIDGSIADYIQWERTSIGYQITHHGRDGNWPKIMEDMIAKFSEGFVTKKGKKYIKVIQGNQVHAFVVNTEDDPKFAFGDVLKPSSWSTPARNAARGNVFSSYPIQWTGPLYLSNRLTQGFMD